MHAYIYMKDMDPLCLNNFLRNRFQILAKQSLHFFLQYLHDVPWLCLKKEDTSKLNITCQAANPDWDGIYKKQYNNNNNNGQCFCKRS